ncbi:MAG: YfcC family protein, partial [Acidobacteria bacterium]
MSKSRFRVPHTLVLIFGMILAAQVLTYVLPQGEFEHVAIDEHRYKIVPGTYETLDEAQKLAPWATLTAIPKGFEGAQGIIFFVFIIGGAFGVFRATGAADALIGSLLRRFGNRPSLLIVGGLLVFSFGSSTIGMAEEYLPFVPMLLALCVA